MTGDGASSHVSFLLFHFHNPWIDQEKGGLLTLPLEPKCAPTYLPPSLPPSLNDPKRLLYLAATFGSTAFSRICLTPGSSHT